MRALAFSTGVLHGLRQRALLSDVAVISGASGGGFASYWLLGGLRLGASEGQVLSGPDSKQISRLRQHANGIISLGAKATMLGGFLAQPDLAQLNPVKSKLEHLVADVIANWSASIMLEGGPGPGSPALGVLARLK